MQALTKQQIPNKNNTGHSHSNITANDGSIIDTSINKTEKHYHITTEKQLKTITFQTLDPNNAILFDPFEATKIITVIKEIFKKEVYIIIEDKHQTLHKAKIDTTNISNFRQLMAGRTEKNNIQVAERSQLIHPMYKSVEIIHRNRIYIPDEYFSTLENEYKNHPIYQAIRPTITSYRCPLESYTNPQDIMLQYTAHLGRKEIYEKMVNFLIQEYNNNTFDIKEYSEIGMTIIPLREIIESLHYIGSDAQNHTIITSVIKFLDYIIDNIITKNLNDINNAIILLTAMRSLRQIFEHSNDNNTEHISTLINNVITYTNKININDNNIINSFHDSITKYAKLCNPITKDEILKMIKGQKHLENEFYKITS
jgi:hypothetical protein